MALLTLFTCPIDNKTRVVQTTLHKRMHDSVAVASQRKVKDESDPGPHGPRDSPNF